MSINRDIYNFNYTPIQLQLNPTTSYDEEMIRIRLDYIKKYGAGKNVLDLCCGTGSYLLPLLADIKSAVGLDFSSNMLKEFHLHLEEAKSNLKVQLIEADARSIPLPSNQFDLVFAYTSLYYIPNVHEVIDEVKRVLRPGGVAVLEFGNIRSINQPVSIKCHQTLGWAKPEYVSIKMINNAIDKAGFNTIEHRYFQLLPMYGAPKGMLFLLPILSPRWKSFMGIKFRGKMFDEWISSSWLFRNFAFRHLYILSKNKKID